MAIIVENAEDVSAFGNITLDDLDASPKRPTEHPPVPSNDDASAAESPKSNEPLVSKQDPSDRIKASPLAKKLAKENNINLDGTDVSGSGVHGRIVQKDVQSIIRNGESSPRTKTNLPYTDRPLSSMRRVNKPEILPVDINFHHILADRQLPKGCQNQPPRFPTFI